ncbi:MAG: zinc ribbon domain-containing protein [Promethearchaeota archaeon]
MKVQLVNAKDTSQICSECRRLRVPDFADKIGANRSPANSKDFSCSHPIHSDLERGMFHLDADLNAARNIALSPPLDPFRTTSVPSPALA